MADFLHYHKQTTYPYRSKISFLQVTQTTTSEYLLTNRLQLPKPIVQSLIEGTFIVGTLGDKRGYAEGSVDELAALSGYNGIGYLEGDPGEGFFEGGEREARGEVLPVGAERFVEGRTVGEEGAGLGEGYVYMVD